MPTKNWKNDGHRAEKEVQLICQHYQAKDVAYIEKIDPPVLTIKKFGKPVTLYRKNPFLDFMGVWTAYDSVMVTFELKSTSEPKLGLGRSGFSDNQMAAARSWYRKGAAVFLLWEHKGEMTFWTLPMVNDIYQGGAGRKHLKWHEGQEVRPGEGFILWDFMHVAEQYAIHEPASVMLPPRG